MVSISGAAEVTDRTAIIKGTSRSTKLRGIDL